MRFLDTEATPERTAFVRFRRLLVAHRLDGALSDAVTVKTSTIVDATIIASSTDKDGDGWWVKHKGKRATHGFKAHVGCDADTALIERIGITPANMNDGRAGPDALPDDLGRSSPTARIADRISAVPFALGAARRASC